MEDDTKLKIVIFAMVAVAVVVIIGAWEFFIKPLAEFIAGGISII